MKSIIEKNLSEIRAIERHINDFKNRLTELEKGREQCTTLQFLKKRDFDKQISDCKEKIKEYEKTLEGHSISEKILNHEKELQKYIEQINDKSIHANNLTSQAQEHLKEYKLMIQAKECLNPSPKRIIERYDKEYEPPKEYSSLLSHQNKEGLPKGKANEQEEIKKTIEYWKDIMNSQKVNKMLEEPQISTPKKSIDRGISR
jgi:exonuclease VII large subunit